MNANTIDSALNQNPGSPANAPIVISVWALSTQQQMFGTFTGYQSAFVPAVLNIPNSSSSSYSTANVASGFGAGNANEGLLSGGALPQEEWSADGQRFVIHIAGKIAPITVSGVFRLWLNLGNGIASANPGLAANPATIPLVVANATLGSTVPYDDNFYLDAQCLWDSTSNVLNVVTSGMIGGTAIAAAALRTANVQASPLQFTVGASLSLQASNAVTPPATITLTDFCADRI